MKIATPSDFKYAEEIVLKSQSSFAMGMNLLPHQQRGYLFGIYAFCRELDDIADQTDSQDYKRQQIAEWRQKIEQLKIHNAPCPITRLLLEAHLNLDIPIDEMSLLVDGMERDINGPIQAPSWEELTQYCREVAVSVGLLSLPIFGRTDQKAQTFAHHLGHALQLTNILRDLTEDARDNRLYLPREALIATEIDTTTPDALNHRHINQAINLVIERASEFYVKAEQALAIAGAQNLRPAIAMMKVYYALFEKIKRTPYSPQRDRIRLNKMEKMMLTMQAMAV